MIRRRRLGFIAAVMWVVGGPGSGTAGADDVQVNTYTTGGQSDPRVALDVDGDAVVVWESSGSSGTDSLALSVQGQRYAGDGSTVGGEFQVNTYTTSAQRDPSVALDVDGDFVVVWQSIGSGGTDSSGFSIQGQRYASDGTTAGGEFQINTYTTNDQFDAMVALDADGDFVVVWTSYSGSGGTDSSAHSVQGQRYASDGFTVGGEFQVNTYTTSYQVTSSVGLSADGDFVIVWSSDGSGGTDSSSTSIQGQRYASDGLTVGGEFQVNTYTTSYQLSPSVALDTDGDFVVVWHSYGSSGADDLFSIQGRRYASDGSPVGAEFQVNTYTTSHQRYPSVALSADGDFLVVWNSLGSGGTDTDGYSVQKTPAKLIFTDGFESGGTAAWSNTVGSGGGGCTGNTPLSSPSAPRSTVPASLRAARSPSPGARSDSHRFRLWTGCGPRLWARLPAWITTHGLETRAEPAGDGGFSPCGC